MIWPSFIPPRPQRQLRDLTRHRRTLTHERTREMQRAEKLLEDAQVKLSSVISGIFGKCGRDMPGALVAGQRDPYVLAGLALWVPITLSQPLTWCFLLGAGPSSQVS